MTSRRVAVHSGLIALTAPQVVAHRLFRMALAGARPSSTDRAEFARMSTEKVAAFYESWYAMSMQSLRIQQETWAASMRAMWFPWQARPFDPARQTLALHNAGLRVLGKGLVPVSRRTVANAKRLGRTSRRR
ncbi:MAG: polyhydroxyalkanoate granule-associated phasin [Casimicrobiaceae bacterium]